MSVTPAPTAADDLEPLTEPSGGVPDVIETPEALAGAVAAFAAGTGPVAADAERASGLLRLFLKHRWIGIWPILYGQQVRQTALDHWIFAGTLDVEHLPQPGEEVVL